VATYSQSHTKQNLMAIHRREEAVRGHCGSNQACLCDHDPARDIPAALRRWLDLFDQRFIGLTGSDRAIEAPQRSSGVPPTTKAGPSNTDYAVSHANFVLAYAKDNLPDVIYLGGVSKDDWVHDLPLVITGNWIGRANNRSWLYIETSGISPADSVISNWGGSLCNINR
jgi:hypothetical protein